MERCSPGLVVDKRQNGQLEVIGLNLEDDILKRVKLENPP